jgi:hypothetical protein
MSRSALLIWTSRLTSQLQTNSTLCFALTFSNTFATLLKLCVD